MDKKYPTLEQVVKYNRILYFLGGLLLVMYAIIVVVFGYFFHIDIFGYSDRDYSKFYISFSVFIFLVCIAMYIYGKITKNPYFKWRPLALNIPKQWREGGTEGKLTLILALPVFAFSIFVMVKYSLVTGLWMIVAYIFRYQHVFMKFIKQDYKELYGSQAGVKAFELHEKNLYQEYSWEQRLFTWGVTILLSLMLFLGIYFSSLQPK